MQPLSTVSPVSASTLPPTRFFTSPYRPKDSASDSEIHGSDPCATTSTVIATTAMPTATPWARRSRSPRKIAASTTVTSGLMKYPRAASAVRPELTA